MMGSIKAAERMGQEDTAAAEGVKKEYLAASADGSVRRMQVPRHRAPHLRVRARVRAKG